MSIKGKSRVSVTALAAVGLWVSASVVNPVMADEASDWMFTHLDADGDGLLSQKELRGAYLDSEGEDWTIGLRPACTAAIIKAMDPELTSTFEDMDSNDDGQVGKSEFAVAGMKMYAAYWDKAFAKADKNDNGELSRKEFVSQVDAYYDNLKEQYADDKIPAACRVDIKDLQISSDEITTAKIYFKVLDRDDDGALSKAEYMTR